MEYTATHTAMMDVIASLNNRIIPVNLPYEYESFLTSEVVNGIIEAMNYNDSYKCFHFYTIRPSQYFEGVQMSASITYYPFDIEPEVEASSVQLPLSFEFTLDNTYLDSWDFATNEKKLNDLILLNRAHRYFHSLGFEPYAKKRRNIEAKFMGMFYTKHDYTPPSTASEFIRSQYPINAKMKLLDDAINDTTLRVAFGFPPRKPYSSEPGVVNEGAKFAIGSPLNFDNVIHSTIKIFLAMSSDGLILKPSEGGEILPYHYKTLYYANPHYGYYDNFYNVVPFWGGGYDSKNNDLINGTAYACGFKVVWFTDTEFWITLKYKLVYQDKRPLPQYDPTLCCLAQCFGITN